MTKVTLSDFIAKGFVMKNGVLTRPVGASKGALASPTPSLASKPLVEPSRGQESGVQVLVLPFPPSVNDLWITNRKTGHRFLAKEAKAYGDAVRRCAALAYFKPPLEGDIVFNMWLYRPRKSGDLSNYYKLLQDVLEGIMYVNDKQIAEEHGYRFDDPTNPRVEVSVHPL